MLVRRVIIPYICNRYNQAQALNLPLLGKIEHGYFADLTVLDADFNVKQVYVNGECRFTA